MTTKTINLNLPALPIDAGMSNYLAEIKKFPMLSPEEEYMLAKRWKKRGDLKSAQKLITSHLRLVAKIAMRYKGYGLPVNEIISEGNIGLMQAVKKFDPEKGFKLATYAMWWIKASIQEYILRSWSLVKIGTTSAAFENSWTKATNNQPSDNAVLHSFSQNSLSVYDLEGSPKIVFVFLGLLILTEALLADIYNFLFLNEIYLRFMNITIKYCC